MKNVLIFVIKLKKEVYLETYMSHNYQVMNGIPFLSHTDRYHYCTIRSASGVQSYCIGNGLVLTTLSHQIELEVVFVEYI